jgi:hypothetical protein
VHAISYQCPSNLFALTLTRKLRRGLFIPDIFRRAFPFR